MNWLSFLLATVALLGTVQVMTGLMAVRRFRRTAEKRLDTRGPVEPATAETPLVTVLKPLHGDEPLLEEALASFCRQQYPGYQLVFGVQDPADPALAVVRRLQARFPACDIAVVVDETLHGANRKIGNLINMYAAARHDVVVIADSDVHVAPDYLSRIVAALQLPATGLVTTLYTGLPARAGLTARLGASQISHTFLPGALLARALGRQDCLGATMALRRETLEAIGGLAAIGDHLADDAVLGQRVGALGLHVRLAATVPATTVGEGQLSALFNHELRWARTIRSLVPVGFALSMVQYPIAWAALAVAASAGDAWSCGVLGLAWATRAVGARSVDRALGLSVGAPVWLLPLRDMMSLSVIIASYRGKEVRWRGQVMRVDTHTPASAAPGHPYPVAYTSPRTYARPQPADVA